MGGQYNGSQRKTWYNGHCYDSKLEAQWAFFFDQVGIKYTPHPGSFRTGQSSKGTEITYSPDFYFRDYAVFGEVKPSDEHLNESKIQRKISAAMTNNFSPIGNGLLILGPFINFKANEQKKFCLWGEYYAWAGGAIAKCFWEIGKSVRIGSESEIKIYLTDPNWEVSDCFSHYPYFGKNPSVSLWKDSSHVDASERIYEAIFDVIFVDRQEHKIFTYDESNVKPVTNQNVSWNEIPWD